MLLAQGQRNNLLAAIYEYGPFSIIVTKSINIIITIATIIVINIILIIVFEVVVEIVVVVANKNHLTNSACCCLEEMFKFPFAIWQSRVGVINSFRIHHLNTESGDDLLQANLCFNGCTAF